MAEPAHPRARASGPGCLQIRGLRARHPGQTRWALSGVDLDLEAGARVGLIGPSGAGKTTLTWALVRFLPYRGSIALDGVEIDDLPAEEVRGVVGLVAQDAHVFDTRSRRTSAWPAGTPATPSCSRCSSGCACSSGFGGCPTGSPRRWGSRGGASPPASAAVSRSPGACWRSFPLLILDEPGEHLDVPAARALTSELVDAARGRTLLLITHRLESMEEMDEVVLLEGGRVAERGTHTALMERDRRYAALFREQRAPGTDA